ncbi:MAG TPA: LCP family protein [Armatimonadota bacterium]|nr:LCP family protein [Armatimonadota bacterium]
MRALLALLFVGMGIAAGAIYHLSRPFVTPGAGLSEQVREIRIAATNPRDAFPNKSRLYILCLGIDANHTSKGIMHTKNARSDTIFVVSLDLDAKRVGMLSVPRDTRVEFAYGRGTDKINAAHAIGGVPLAKATVEQFLGIEIDHYVVIKMYGTRNMIDAMGGVVIDVEKDMDYDDNWGNLHIHLKKGRQRLNGEQAVGYVRFRHDAESDFGRMRRQQQLVKAVARQLMTPSTLLNLDKLVDIAMENTITDLSRSQILALAHLFYNVPPEKIYTGTIAGYDYRGSNGIWYLDPSESKKEALVGWLLRGEEWYRNGLITVRVHNASGINGVASTLRDILADQGYNAIIGRSERGERQPLTRVVDLTGKTEAAQEIARLLPNARVDPPTDDEKPEPSGPDILVKIGTDCARAIGRSL